MKGLLSFIFIFFAASISLPHISLSEMTSPAKDLPALKHPSIIIRKKSRTLEVYDQGKLVKTYKVVLGFAPEGDKEIEGDGRTPEGEFYVFVKNDKSQFHLSLGLSYPDTEDAERGRTQSLISDAEYNAITAAIAAKKMPPQKTRLGGEIYIHGGGIGSDWTAGCVAMENDEIAELFRRIPLGTSVQILS